MKTQAPAGDTSANSHLNREVLTHFFSYFRPYKRSLIIGLIPIPVSILSSIAFPWLVMQIIDQQLVTRQWQGMPMWIGLLILVLVANYAASTIYSYYIQKAAQFAIRDLRTTLFNRVLHFPRSYFDITPVGVTLTRLTSDLEAVNESLAVGLLGMVRDVLTTVALLIFLATISWQLTLVTLLVAPPMYWITSVLRRRLHDVYLQSRKILSTGTGYLQECLQGIKTVQFYRADREVQARYQQYTAGFFKTQSRSNLYDAALFSVIEGMTTITMGLIIAYGAVQLLAASISLGVLIGFIQTLDKIFVPVRDITSQIATIQRALASLNHIHGVFQQPMESEHDALLSVDLHTASVADQLNRFQQLEFNEVKFRYNPQGPYVLDGVSFTLQRGQKIALVGSTGSGKSTIIRLLTKVYMGYEGSITLNGIELRVIPKPLVAKFFSLMQQEVYLFNQSIAFNIGLDREGVDQQAIIAAAKYVYADEFIERLPQKYNFLLDHNGANLSSGQGQMIAFARAIASGSDVVLLDEATSTVDSVTEQMIQRAIDHVFMDKTVIAIAHRLSTIQHSDQILVLDKGQIIESGNHAELMRRSGAYARLVKAAEVVD